MINSLFSGISGLKANTSAMAVIGDNIANVDTNGFKSSKVSFANIFSSSLTRTGLEIGRGVSLNGVSAKWESGVLESTSNATDLSINGTGLFIVNDPSTLNSYYTRAGQFEWNNEGSLVTPDGFVVQGYSIAPDGTVGPIGDIELPNGTSAPSATTNISFGMNLNGDAADADTFTSSITTYDSLGSEVILDVVFTYDEPNAEWDWVVNPSVGSSSSSGSITFDTDGVLTSPVTNPTIVVDDGAGGNFPNGAAPLSITWTMVDAAGVSDGSITGYSSASTKTAQSQDGYPSGNLQSVSVDENGYFTGIYSSGSMIPFAQVALADFPSYSGLSKMGSNLYAASLSSGQALVSVPNSASLGSIAPTSLEMSNVDLAGEFVEMITTQRAYQANSKVITTSDEILQELLNIKR